MTLLEYYERLDRFDCWYMMSDDPRVFNRGLAEEAELRRIANQGGNYKLLWDAFRAAWNRGEPYPERPTE